MIKRWLFKNISKRIKEKWWNWNLKSINNKQSREITCISQVYQISSQRNKFNNFSVHMEISQASKSETSVQLIPMLSYVLRTRSKVQMQDWHLTDTVSMARILRFNHMRSKSWGNFREKMSKIWKIGKIISSQIAMLNLQLLRLLTQLELETLFNNYYQCQWVHNNNQDNNITIKTKANTIKTREETIIEMMEDKIDKDNTIKIMVKI